MSRKSNQEWMEQWCERNGATLELDGECGFGRVCVGATAEGGYLEYNWFNEETWERVDENGEVWTPEDAYHRHPCVAVRGIGAGAEKQLFDWLSWFDRSGFTMEVGSKPVKHAIQALMGQDRFARLVRK